ncbi:MAG: hypothetical protein WDM96_07925 [Lacunisphaera sp.]
MIRSGRFLLFALLALWLPATLHCRLEAAGFLAATDHCCNKSGESSSMDCKDDACPTVEDALYKESSATLAASAPVESFGPDSFALLAPPGLELAIPSLSPIRHAPPPELRVAWQFLSRAAPPARAPSLNS